MYGDQKKWSQQRTGYYRYAEPRQLTTLGSKLRQSKVVHRTTETP